MALAGLQLLVGYAWLLAGVDKLLLGAFPAQLGGRLVTAGDLLLAPLERSFNKHTLVKRDDVGSSGQTRIVAGKFINNDACMGAVGLVLWPLLRGGV